ncbi:hypothetical protein GE061_019092 [Apolygus lucorum]|uniref:Uncharacterized protein n=1 Tax=Apolygus lucorum TaxID=248454 RepID=A0A8S9X7G8_APOLU|nr:hypothetical protein GE061_019092 [Apolygus lucorum]
MGPSELVRVVEMVAAQLPPEWTMIAWEDAASVYAHYQSARVSGWHMRRAIHVALAFPLEPRGPRFELSERTRQPRNPGEATTTPQTQISLDLRQGDALAPPPQASKETGSGAIPRAKPQGPGALPRTRWLFADPPC